MARKRLPQFEEGARFGRWTVIKLIGYGRSGSMYECLCDCGTKKEILGDLLRNLRTSSCKKCALVIATRGNFNHKLKG